MGRNLIKSFYFYRAIKKKDLKRKKIEFSLKEVRINQDNF